MKNLILVFASMLCMFFTNAWCQQYSSLESEQNGLGLRASLGTDVNLGLGVGVGASYAWIPPAGGTSVELGADFFFHA